MPTKFAADLHKTKIFGDIERRAVTVFDDLVSLYEGDSHKALKIWRTTLLRERTKTMGGAPTGSRDPERDRLLLLHLEAFRLHNPEVANSAIPRACAEFMLTRFGEEKDIKTGRRVLHPYTKDNPDSFVRYLRSLIKRTNKGG